MISKKFLFVTLLGMLGLTSCKSDQYYKVGNNFDARIFSRTESPVDIYNDEGFRWNKEGDIITLTDSTGVHVYTTKYSALIRFVSDEYIGLLSGLRTFDAGWRYLVYPTYSDLVILNKSDLSLVFRKRIYDRVSDMKLEDGKLYFKYGKYPDFRYGYFEAELAE